MAGGTRDRSIAGAFVDWVLFSDSARSIEDYSGP